MEIDFGINNPFWSVHKSPHLMISSICWLILSCWKDISAIDKLFTLGSSVVLLSRYLLDISRWDDGLSGGQDDQHHGQDEEVGGRDGCYGQNGGGPRPAIAILEDATETLQKAMITKDDFLEAIEIRDRDQGPFGYFCAYKYDFSTAFSDKLLCSRGIVLYIPACIRMESRSQRHLLAPPAALLDQAMTQTPEEELSSYTWTWVMNCTSAPPILGTRPDTSSSVSPWNNQTLRSIWPNKIIMILSISFCMFSATNSIIT